MMRVRTITSAKNNIRKQDCLAFERLQQAAAQALAIYKVETGSRMRRLDWHQRTGEHLQQALEDYSVDELEMSVRGMFLDPFNANGGSRGKPYFSIDIALRPNNVDRFIHRFEVMDLNQDQRDKIDQVVLLPHAKWFLKSEITDAKKLKYTDRLEFRYWWVTNHKPNLARIRTIMYWRKCASLYGWETQYLPRISTLEQLMTNYVKLDQLMEEQTVSEYSTGKEEPMFIFLRDALLPNYKKAFQDMPDGRALRKLKISKMMGEAYLNRIKMERLL